MYLKDYGHGLRTIGEGSDSVVRLYKKKDKLYAIKEIKCSIFAKKQIVKQLCKKLIGEYCVESTLDHPNIIKPIEMLVVNGKCYEVMEYYPEGDLFNHILNDNIDVLLGYYSQLVDGLYYIHHTGVAHCDIKPENLLINSEFTLKIADFGICHIFHEPWSTRDQLNNKKVGTLPYMSPEEFTDALFDSKKADLWACGVILYTLFMKHLPWLKAHRLDKNYISYRCNGFDANVCKVIPQKYINILNKTFAANPSKRINVDELRAII